MLHDKTISSLGILNEDDKKNSGIISLIGALIFTSANTFFQRNLIYIADSRTGFRSGHENTS